MHKKDGHHRSYLRQSSGFVNFDGKLPSNEEQGPLSLQQISARKILDKFRIERLVKSDIEGLSTDLLAKIVDSVPPVIPSTNVTGVTSEGRKAAAYDLNFEERAALISAIKGFKPDWEDINLDRWEQRDTVLYYSLFNAHFLPSAAELRVLLMKNDIHVTIVARDCCDLDNVINNYYTKIFVIENNEISFERMDLPQAIRVKDHPLIHKYGHLFKTWKDIAHEERTEFTSQTLGDFKQYWTNKAS
jgi:hypothetical protein